MSKKLENEVEKDDRIKLLYEGEIIGKILTNQSLSVDDCIKLLDIDITDMDWELFKVEY